MQLPESMSARRLEALSDRVVHSPEAQRLEVEAAFSGQPFASVPLSSEKDVDDAFAAAQIAQAHWAATPIADRLAVLRRVHRLALQRREHLIDVVQCEAGKARLHAFEEVVDIAINASYYARVTEGVMRRRRHRGWVPAASSVTVQYQPLGVIGLITPWNYPLTLPVSDALPALAAGNAVVVKPDHHTPFSALVGLQLLEDAGLPADLYQVVVGDGPTTGRAVIDRCDYLAFTGSTTAGRLVAERAGERLVGCSLELGGKNAQLVLRDADIKRAAAGSMRSMFGSAGQLCVSMERVYVVDAVYEAFTEALLHATQQLRVEPSFDYNTDVGSLISATQLARVQAHVDEAVDKGATILCGGKARPDLGPYFFEPTLLTDVNDTMTLCRNETFGPVVSIYRVADEAQAVAMANDSDFGLSACVWTRDVSRGRAIASQLACGSVSINEAYGAFWGSIDVPMGGVKASGLGRRHGTAGLLRYTDAQSVGVQRFVGLGPLPGMSQRRYADSMARVISLLSRIGRP